jgi:cytochrome c peroxidase
MEGGTGGSKDRTPAEREIEAGYKLFTGKAQCSVCHPPPLYTDHAYHRLGLVAVADEGRGKVEPNNAKARGAFRTVGLRGAARRASFFHDGSATTLEAAIDWHLDGGKGQGADRSIVDLPAVTLTATERTALIAFVRALTADAGAAKYPRPLLPQ